MPELVVSKPGDVRRTTKLVELPVQQDGATIVVRLGAVPKLVIVEAMDGLPGAVASTEGERGWTEIRATVVSSIKPEQKVAAAGILEPEFSFGEREDGKAFWDDLSIDNQAFVIKEILDLSGWKGASPSAAKTFPAGGEGQ